MRGAAIRFISTDWSSPGGVLYKQLKLRGEILLAACTELRLMMTDYLFETCGRQIKCNKLLRNVCIVLVSLTYVCYDARYRECKVSEVVSNHQFLHIKMTYGFLSTHRWTIHPSNFTR